jgi:superfamily II DNA helicase RecQ
VLLTGAGKSLLFIIPAIMLDKGTSVVIVPFNTLKKDLIKRARDIGVDVIKF